MTFRQLFTDGRNVARGVARMLALLRRGDRVDLALAQLSAESAAAVRGARNRYEVTITNARFGSGDVTLRIQVDAVDADRRVDRRCASFSKRLTVAPRASLEVAVEYDWLAEAAFRVGGVRCWPDDLSTGTPDRPGPYAVSAVLLDPAGTRLDAVTVYQHLRP